jgi:hypothetical protein
LDLNSVLEVGHFCEQLLQNPTFQFICAYFEQNAAGEFLSTKGHELKSREAIYARVQAHREFLTMLGGFVSKKNEAVTEQPDHSDDDPTVHDIYKGYVD